MSEERAEEVTVRWQVVRRQKEGGQETIAEGVDVLVGPDELAQFVMEKMKEHPHPEVRIVIS